MHEMRCDVFNTDVGDCECEHPGFGDQITHPEVSSGPSRPAGLDHAQLGLAVSQKPRIVDPSDPTRPNGAAVRVECSNHESPGAPCEILPNTSRTVPTIEDLDLDSREGT